MQEEETRRFGERRVRISRNDDVSLSKSNRSIDLTGIATRIFQRYATDRHHHHHHHRNGNNYVHRQRVRPWHDDTSLLSGGSHSIERFLTRVHIYVYRMCWCFPAYGERPDSDMTLNSLPFVVPANFFSKVKHNKRCIIGVSMKIMMLQFNKTNLI